MDYDNKKIIGYIPLLERDLWSQISIKWVIKLRCCFITLWRITICIRAKDRWVINIDIKV